MFLATATRSPGLGQAPAVMHSHPLQSPLTGKGAAPAPSRLITSICVLHTTYTSTHRQDAQGFLTIPGPKWLRILEHFAKLRSALVSANRKLVTGAESNVLPWDKQGTGAVPGMRVSRPKRRHRQSKKLRKGNKLMGRTLGTGSEFWKVSDQPTPAPGGHT